MPRSHRCLPGPLAFAAGTAARSKRLIRRERETGASSLGPPRGGTSTGALRPPRGAGRITRRRGARRAGTDVAAGLCGFRVVAVTCGTAVRGVLRAGLRGFVGGERVMVTVRPSFAVRGGGVGDTLMVTVCPVSSGGGFEPAEFEAALASDPLTSVVVAAVEASGSGGSALAAGTASQKSARLRKTAAGHRIPASCSTRSCGARNEAHRLREPRRPEARPPKPLPFPPGGRQRPSRGRSRTDIHESVVRQMSAARLSICVVTMRRELIDRFLVHHRELLQFASLEWLIFVEEGDRAALAARWPHVEFRANAHLQGVSEKRNVLLAEASSARVLFLDDDSLIECTATFSSWVVRNSELPRWTLFATRFHGRDFEELVPPRALGSVVLGSGVEWNQLFDTEALRQLGGWDPRFGPGHRWGAGEATILMLRLPRVGLRQTLVPEIVITHPSPLGGGVQFRDLPKYRRYRRAQGAVLLALRPEWSGLEFAARLGRFALWPIAGVPVALLQRKYALAALRICTPFDVIAGMVEFVREDDPPRGAS
jgi:hypothetical protein